MEIKDMAGHGNTNQSSKMVETLKRLPREDRILLSLYLYEGLTAEQIDTIMDQKNAAPRAMHYNKKSLFRNLSKPF
jgi:DNA-directed RNA polymerase specialized sigma24 family protein